MAKRRRRHLLGTLQTWQPHVKTDSSRLTCMVERKPKVKTIGMVSFVAFRSRPETNRRFSGAAGARVIFRRAALGDNKPTVAASKSASEREEESFDGNVVRTKKMESECRVCYLPRDNASGRLRRTERTTNTSGPSCTPDRIYSKTVIRQDSPFMAAVFIP